MKKRTAQTRPAGTLLFATALLLAGCGGPLSNTIDDDVLEDMSRQGQIEIYDAENGIIVALDRLDEARDELLRIRGELDLAKERIEAAEKRGNRLGIDVAEGWRVYLESMERWAKANVALQKLGVVVARAQVELAKAEVVQREDLLGGRSFSAGRYQEQAKTVQAEYQRRAAAVRKLRARARKLETKWWALRRRYVAQTGDHDNGLWID